MSKKVGARVAVYARVSTAEQDAEMQIAELRDLAARRSWEITSEYVDTGVSGTKASRPELDRLMADARRRRFDLVLCWRFDRFARSTAHLLAALDEFRSLGVDFVSLNESIDTTTPLGKMVFTVVASVAELERSIIVERVRAGLARAKAKGKRLGRPRGSRIDVSRVGALIRKGLSLRQIATDLGIGLGSASRAARAFQESLSKSGPASPMARKAK
jgi:DNA invertase Pin-like site-specific DNA recombinase